MEEEEEEEEDDEDSETDSDMGVHERSPAVQQRSSVSPSPFLSLWVYI